MLIKKLSALVAAAAAVALVAGCTSNVPQAPATSAPPASQPATAAPGEGNDAPGENLTIGLSAPAADHGWMGAITSAAVAEAAKFSDVTLDHPEGTNDVNAQIAQIETFINNKVDAIVVLPFDGEAMTDIALKAMAAGIPVINVDREFSSSFAARTTILGDNYGMGLSTGTYLCEALAGKTDAVIGEIQGIANLKLTQDRSQGFADALAKCGMKVSHKVEALFTVESGEEAAQQLLQAAPKLDAVWNHDDDQGIGVMAAFNASGRNEFIMVGGAGSADMMELIKADNTVVKATTIYPSTQAADGIRLARLLAHGKALSDLVELEVPRQIMLYAPVVTKENVDQFLPTAFRS